MPLRILPNRSSTRRHHFLCCLLGAVVLSGCADPKTTATSLLRVRLAEGKTDDANSYDAYKRTQAQLVTSPFVLRAALRPPVMQQLKTLRELSEPVEWLEKNIKVKYPGDSEILKVSLQCRDAKEAKTIVDAIVSAYLNEVGQAERNDSAERLDLLRATQRRTVRDLQEILADAHGLDSKIGNPESSLGKLNHELEMEMLANKSEQLATLQSEMLTTKVDLKVYQELASDQTAADAGGPAAEATNIKAKESAARYEILKAEAEKLNSELSLSRETFRDKVAFSAELEAKKMEAEILRKRIASLSEQIHHLDITMKRKPRVQLIQSADTKQ